MARYITQIHLVGGSRHEHIAEVTWEDRSTGVTDQSSRADMVGWIETGGDARVAAGSSYVQVGVVNATPKYIRTHKDGIWTDNLLALPTY
ncbi:MAG TPA: DUF3892 domain-containing protein [Acidimicrobiales bacterium]|jgi:hypothetical protein|nr:DUF3892 domain-containing protein [Acidimicrobiales bacterium]